MYLFSQSIQSSAQILMVSADGDLHLPLMQAGYGVIPATSGVEALAKFQMYEVDLVVLDITLPQMDGFAVCQQLRQHSNVPIILLTPNDADAIVRGLDMGADDAVHYPVSSLELMARIEALCRRLNSLAGVVHAPSELGMEKKVVAPTDFVYPAYWVGQVAQ
jgi:two-component system, OmpR family, response regulator